MSLTTAEVFDLLAEHAECWCTDAEKENGIESETCPKNRAQDGHGYAADGGKGIPQEYFPFDAIEGYLHVWDEMPRVVIALLLWRITAEFAYDPTGLVPKDGQTVTDAAEQYVRDNWLQAEAHSLAFVDNVLNDVIISSYLDQLHLLDDYMRVKNSTQHKAFQRPEETTR